MSRAPSALLLYGMSARYGGSIHSEDVGGHPSTSLVSAIIWNSPATTAPSDDERPVKDRNASSDLEQHNRTVKDQKAVRTWVLLLVGHSKKITSSRTTFKASETVHPIPQ
ncbi:hypothetical protein QAD02_013777 [Eretmocerus hayati]|uniref:Uncharacterized protein n=2 Tax=Eretmocerus hayati TaxID=131215 RepID=A0ACC2P794_9HYME|nr:hypothetical protein QAD02_013442 [Eretmocerus hayati]KAJ8677990.1 hypothetical protein QAD02_013777 [Eretmocerus hayati]